MRTFLYTLHVLTCLSLIVVVLIQRGKGADMGAMLGGGGSQTVFGPRGAGSFLTRFTTAAAVVFMATSLTLSYLAVQDSRSTIFDDEPIPEAVAPAEDAAPAVDPSLLEEIESPAAVTPSPAPDAAADAAPESAPAAP